MKEEYDWKENGATVSSSNKETIAEYARSVGRLFAGHFSKKYEQVLECLPKNVSKKIINMIKYNHELVYSQSKGTLKVYVESILLYEIPLYETITKKYVKSCKVKQ